MKKRIISFLMATMMLLSLAACGNNDSNTATTPDTTQTTQSDSVVKITLTTRNLNEIFGYEKPEAIIEIPDEMPIPEIIRSIEDLPDDSVYHVTSIEDNLFEYWCQKTETDPSVITEIKLPNTLTSLGEHVFQNLTGLTSIIIPEGITELPTNTFYGCTNLETVTLHDNITYIGNYCFNGCENLKEFNWPAKTTSCGIAIFDGCTSLNKLIIPEWMTEVPDGLYANCTNATELIIKSDVITFGTSAFENDIGLTNITLPDSTETVGYRSFDGTGIYEITIPAKTTLLDEWAFANCPNLVNVYMLNKDTKTIYSTFMNCHPDINIIYK